MEPVMTGFEVAYPNNYLDRTSKLNEGLQCDHVSNFRDGGGDNDDPHATNLGIGS